MPIDLNELRKIHEKLNENPRTKSNSNDFLKNFYQLKDGKNAIRILPSTDEDSDIGFYAHTKIHRIPLAEGKARNYHCREVHGETCPLCNLYRELWNEPYGRDSDKDLARKIKGRDRFYLNVVDRDAQENGEELFVKILSIPPTLFNGMIENMVDPVDQVDLVDMENGHDYIIQRKIEDNFPKYTGSQPRMKPSPVGSKQEMAIALSQRHDLQSLVKLYDYDEGMQLVEGLRPDLSYESSDRSERLDS